MIKEESFTPGWIMSHRARKGYQRINPPLVEKMIHALALVERLSFTGLDFVFKGGTSLILLMETPGRFSIDIDIITEAGKNEIESALDKIVAKTPFISYKLNEHRSYQKGIPKAHYSLFYTSGLTGNEDHIILDILFQKHTYPALLEVDVKSQWLATDTKPIKVKVPTLESITGDKLTAFAPNTTGILYGKQKELEIVKQLYDIGRLFDRITDFEVVKKAFLQTVRKEIEYRGSVHTIDNVLEDIVLTGIMIGMREKNVTEPVRSNFNEIKSGLLQFKAYQMESFFRIEEAIIFSAKAAYMAALIKIDAKGKIEMFAKSMKKEDHLIEHPDFILLNKLAVEPLFYLNLVVRMLYPNSTLLI